MSDLRPHQAPADLPLVGAATQRSQWLAALVDQLRALAAPLNEARAAVQADPAGYDHATYREGYDEWLRKSPELHAQIGGRLRGLEPTRPPGGLLLPGDNWAPPLLGLIGAETEPAVVTLILHLAALGSPRPSRRWRSECLRLLEPARAREIVLTGLHGLAGCEPAVLRSALPLPREYRAVVCEQNAPVARGVVWAAALAGGDQVTGDLTATC